MVQNKSNGPSPGPSPSFLSFAHEFRDDAFGLPWRWKNPLRDDLGSGNGAIPRSSIWMQTCQVIGQFSAQSSKCMKASCWTILTAA